jgi:hypothetical protein
VIFRWLYLRRVHRLFGRYIPSDDPVWQALGQTTEWQALKSFLPDRWFHSEEQMAAAYREIAKTSARLLAERTP